MRTLAVALLSSGLSSAAVLVPDEAIVKVALESDRPTYHVGEALSLTLTVRNEGATPVFGHLRLAPYHPDWAKTAVLEYARRDATASNWTEFVGSVPGIEFKCLEFSPGELAAGKHVQSRLLVSLNPKDGQLVLSTPGDYEIRWRTRGIHTTPGVSSKELGPDISVSAYVRVLPVPPSEMAAFGVYLAGGLARVAQYDPQYCEITPEQIRAAAQFAERFPDSLYTATLRQPLLIRFLRARVSSGDATTDERQLLQRLASEPPR